MNSDEDASLLVCDSLRWSPAGLPNLISNLSIDLRCGQIVLLCGGSGSGKTSALNLLSLLRRPSGGTLLVHNRDAGSMSDQQRASVRHASYGLLFQRDHFLRGTIRENIFLKSQVSGVEVTSELEQGAALLFDYLALSHLQWSDDLTNCSGGERRRLALVRALVDTPELLVLDEPTANLDDELAGKVCDLVLDAAASGAGCIVATHQPELWHSAAPGSMSVQQIEFPL